MGLVDPQVNGNGNGDTFSKYSKYQKMGTDLKEEDEEIQNRQSKSLSSNKYVLACAIFASLNSVLLGYDVGVMSGAILFIQKDLKISQFQEEILVGCLSIISLLGSLGGGRTSDAIGRKWTMGIAAIVFQTGAVIMAAAPSFAVLMVGRLLAGVGIGFGVMIAPIYIAEISPAVARGALTSFPEIFINLGILLGYVSNYIFSGLSVHIGWRVMLAVGVLPSVFIAGALFIIPESPRWLVMQNRIDEAKYVLLKINKSETEVEERLAEIEEAAGTKNPENKYDEKDVWYELLRPSPIIRRMIIAGFGIQCFQQITGIDALVYYSPTVFKKAGVAGDQAVLAATVAVGLTKTIFILVAIFLIDRVGRKPLLYVSTIGMTFCLFGLALTLSLLAHGLGSKELGTGLAILMVCGNVAFFSVGIGPVCWVLTSEIFPLRLRSQAAGLGAVGNRVSSGLIAMSFLSLSGAISMAGTFCLFGIISALAVAFVHFLVPETKGKTLEEIELLFQDASDSRSGEVELGDVERLVQKE
ncbi:probable polyol transporter 4 [Aristolochia californica]|uniref:probable polyol transporter 4 n=1 Tax=Aristolochia californica TaxID=171875 RepID=UPI0035D92612